MTALSRDQLLLPFAEKEYVDVRRAGRILGLSPRAVLELHECGQIAIIDYAKRKWKRVNYKSIVDLCDHLRQQFAIPDRRPPLSAAYLRYRDEDLLPFPITDTMDVSSVMEVLGYNSPVPIYLMIEEGRFESYRLSPRSPWRISATSLAAYLEGVHSRAHGGANSRTSISA